MWSLGFPAELLITIFLTCAHGKVHQGNAQIKRAEVIPAPIVVPPSQFL